MRLLFTTLAFCSFAVAANAADLTLEQIMADPDWMGNGPERPYWADDGDSIYFHQKRGGSELLDLKEVDLRGERVRTIADEDLGKADYPAEDWSDDRRAKTYARNGDIFVKHVRSGRLQQLTQTKETESDPIFLMDASKVAFRRDDTWFVRDVESGLEYQPADLRAEKDPDEEEDSEDFLKAQQKELFEIIRLQEQRRDAAREDTKAKQKADATRTPTPWYFSADVDFEGESLSPRADYMLVRTINKKKRKEGKREAMPNYVTDTGFTATRDVRTRVGTEQMPSEELWLLKLESHERVAFDLSVLPGIKDDPLKAYREAAEKREKENEEKFEDEKQNADENDRAPKKSDATARGVVVRRILWSQDGRNVVVVVLSRDNKDRWIAGIDLKTGAVRPLHRETNEAWINERYAQAEWLPDNRRLYIMSEESGYGHLYVLDYETGEAKALTNGEFEVSSPVLTHDGRYLYYRANVEHPGVYEVYRVATGGGDARRITDLGGNNFFELSPDENRLMISHSTTTMPTEIYVQRAEAGAEARRITRTVSEAFESIEWTAPQIVAVPSSHGAGPIYSRLYTPKGFATLRPAVVFIHGAGYLQNAHQGWSSYFREFMFHSLLVQRGYVVLDMDYRASAGYGAAWRMAIYRQMGTPEVEDLADGVTYLAREHNVDRERVGCYGGSYGGFLTLMALFTRTDLFACGAALRPVTDWAHYNHEYTSNILNIPAIDPESFEKSSPIYFAEGLNKPLLICHGMQDDNVFFQDSVRLAQRLIELKKENWELAAYPIEAHGFREPSSWLDEYRRILKLFETNLKKTN